MQDKTAGPEPASERGQGRDCRRARSPRQRKRRWPAGQPKVALDAPPVLKVSLPFVKQPIQVSRVHGLQQLDIYARLDRLLTVFVLAVPGDGDQQGPLAVRLVPNLSGDRPAVQPRQADV